MNESLEFTSWNKIKFQVYAVNSEFAKLLEELDPGTSDSLIVAHYPFGKDIVKMGQLYLPDQQEILPSNHTHFAKLSKQFLNYAKIPVGIVLNKSVEVYYETPQRVVSDKLWYQGAILGAWELFDQPIAKDSTQLANISSGARSIFMLPKISDSIAHNRLKKALHIALPPPAHSRQHRDLFATIAANIETNNKWHCSILYLTEQWLIKRNNPAFINLQNYFLKLAWHQSYNCRRQFELNMVWEKVLNTISNQNIYLQPKLSSHLKQLYMIAESVFPGMIFAIDNNNEIAPIKLIQDAYTNIYRLKDYAPLLMHPCHITKDIPVYYSLNYPNYFESFLPTKSVSRLMDEIRIISNIIELIQQKNIDFLPQPSFTYFHPHSLGNHKIEPINAILHDASLQKYFKKYKDLALAQNSAFFNGCIKISI
ncbi:MAG: hypothetical protein A3E87_07300 [Gammaproteobacteria bacterium RIFCSPHIGHO2_12_FULL_35_23]|nr:MAG: hypothetical protein A3E87_07300 [Gammaproteobacteria bacterium RIFCSPHIGHO2_12_FULL_35_23]